MKTLYLLRHAQAQSSPSVKDIERPLAPQGTSAARGLGRVMTEKSWRPTLTLCSPALRTRETLDGLREFLDCGRVDYPDELYNASRETLLRLIRETDDSLASLLVIAHNPGIHELAASLDDESSPLSGKLMTGYRPGTLSVFSSPVDQWADTDIRGLTLTALTEAPDYD